jgi:hypothetical protein
VTQQHIPEEQKPKIASLLRGNHSPSTALWGGYPTAVEVNQSDVNTKERCNLIYAPLASAFS